MANQQCEIRQLRSDAAECKSRAEGAVAATQWTTPPLGDAKSAGVQPWMSTVSPAINPGWTGWYGCQQQEALSTQPLTELPADQKPPNEPSRRWEGKGNWNRHEKLGNDVCRLYRQRGHWQNQCPRPVETGQQRQQANVGSVSVNLSKSESSLDIQVNGNIGHCLFSRAYRSDYAQPVCWFLL